MFLSCLWAAKTPKAYASLQFGLDLFNYRRADVGYWKVSFSGSVLSCYLSIYLSICRYTPTKMRFRRERVDSSLGLSRLVLSFMSKWASESLMGLVYLPISLSPPPDCNDPSPQQPRRSDIHFSGLLMVAFQLFIIWTAVVYTHT